MSAGGAVDRRAFRWPLAALLRKLDLQAQAAQVALAVAQHRERAARSAVEAVQQAQEGHAREILHGLQGRLDARRHAQDLLFLLRGTAALEARQADHAAAAIDRDDAHGACVHGELQLAALRELEAKALREWGAEQARREAREADLAWLARRTWCAPARRGSEGKA